MRVLLQGRNDLFDRPGGDTIQALKTAEHLRRLGVEAELNIERRQDLGEFDLVHLFNTTVDNSALARAAHTQGRPVVLSTIYWNRDELLAARLQFGQAGWLVRLLGRTWASRLRQWIWYAQPEWRAMRALVHEVDLLLPNSQAETELLYRDFGLRHHERVRVVTNGVDPTPLLGATRQSFLERFSIQGFLLSVGRIEVRKNQLALLRVLRPDDPPAVFIGALNQREPNYVASVLELAREKNVRIIESLPHAEMASAYAAARAHVLPSWYETPGLASLEAAVVGCPVVTTDRGCAREYFGDLAHYCDPANPKSIRAALDSGLSAPRADALRDHILANFTWEVAARQTFDAYKAVAPCS